MGLGVADISPSSSRRTGGFGRPAVDKPVVLARYGIGGGAGFSTACAALCSSTSSACMPSAGNNAPVPLRIGATALGTAAPPWKLTFLGGGPKVSGSFKDARGRDECSVALRELFGSLPWPTHPAYSSIYF